MTIQQRYQVLRAIDALRQYDTLMQQLNEAQIMYTQIRRNSVSAHTRAVALHEAQVRGARYNNALIEAQNYEKAHLAYATKVHELGIAIEHARTNALMVAKNL